MDEVTIVFPALNERTRLIQTLRAYCDYFGTRASLVVVDNGSSDGTVGELKEIFPHSKQIHVLTYPQPLGKGGAVYAGFDAARTEFVGFADADGSIPPSEFDKLLVRKASDHVVIASRWVPGAQMVKKQSIVRQCYGRLFNVFVNLLFKFNVRDTQCGAKIMSRELYQRIQPLLHITAFAFDVDLLLRARQAGAKIVEVPIIWTDSEGSSVSQRSGLNAVKDIWRLWRRQGGQI